jgi:DNA-directed RNA polymerase specialized sigma24 family protein
VPLHAIESDWDPVPSATGLADIGVGGDPVAAAESAELRAQVSASIERLPFNYRAAVTLRFLTGLDYAAAAEAMGVPLNTFKSHLLRGTRLLRSDLARHLDPAQGDEGPTPETPPPDPAPDRAAPIGSRGLPEPTSTRQS